MKDLSIKIGKWEWLEILLASCVLIAALIIPSGYAQIATAVFFVLYAFFKPFQSLVILIPYVIFRTFLIEVNDGMKLIGDLMTVVIVFRLFLLNIRQWKTWLYFKPFEWFYFLFLIVGAVVGYKNGVSIGAIVFQLRTFGVMYLLYYILSRSELPKNLFVKIGWVTLFSGYILVLQGLVEKLSLRRLFMPEDWVEKVLSVTNFVRIYGMLNNPNSLALVMFFTLCAVFFLQYVYKGRYKWLFLVSQVAFIGILLLTLSRGTWIASVTFIIFFMLLSRNWRWLKQVVLATVAAIILVYYPVNLTLMWMQSIGVENPQAPESTGGISNRFSETFSEDTLNLMTETGRIYYIKKSFEILKDYPVVGAGFGTFGGSATLSYGSPIYEKYGIQSETYSSSNDQYVMNFYSDNQYIQVIAETGTVGVILFAGFLLSMLWMFWKERKTAFGQYMIALWFVTGICGVFYNIWELKVYVMFYFIIFGVFVSMQRLYPTVQLSKTEYEDSK